MIFITILKLLICIILAYLIGSFPSAYVVGKVFFNRDIRKMGSGNVGTTNTYRVFGFLPGTVVLLLDIFKGTLGASLPLFFGIPGGKPWMILVGFAAVIGHCYSIFLNFKGGKAVATGSGILLAYDPKLFFIAAALFLVIILLTSTVSIASLIVLPFVTIMAIVMKDPYLFVVALIVTGIVYYKHIPNIKRLKNHDENIVHFGLVYYLRKKHSQKTN